MFRTVTIILTAVMLLAGSVTGVNAASQTTDEVDEVLDYLNYGLYWLGTDGAKEKFSEGDNNAYYDPDKPTVIYFHGWQQSSSENGYKIPDLEFEDADVWTQNGWIEKGYNVGIFHWAQWADEDDVQWAESKIWTRNGPKGFRYRLSNGEFSTDLNPSGSGGVGDLAADILLDALADNSSDSLRFAGHSLGNQLATRVAQIFHDKIETGTIDADTYSIDRLALLDPAWTKDGKSWLGDSNGDGSNDWVGERCRWAIADMMDDWDGFVVEMYSTTALSESLGIAMDANMDLQEVVASVDVRPWYYGSTELAKKHNAAFLHYFYSMAADPPVECTVSWWSRKATGKMGPSASTPDWRIKEMMGDTYKWDQVEGRYTEDTSDDWFERKSF